MGQLKYRGKWDRLENYLGGENFENLSYYILDCP